MFKKVAKGVGIVAGCYLIADVIVLAVVGMGRLADNLVDNNCVPSNDVYSKTFEQTGDSLKRFWSYRKG